MRAAPPHALQPQKGRAVSVRPPRKCASRPLSTAMSENAQQGLCDGITCDSVDAGSATAKTSDIYDRATRSRIMSSVRSRDTKPELRVRSALHGAGYRFRLNGRELPGRPDVVLPRFRLAVFVNGCFWHQHSGCKRASIPKTNYDFWLNKLTANKQRDEKNYVLLEEIGWKVATIWQCLLQPDIDNLIEQLGGM